MLTSHGALAQVGHTGDLKAVVQAVTTCDKQLGELLEAVEAQGGRWLVTSDHGNADDMVQVRHLPGDAIGLTERGAGWHRSLA